MNHDVMLLTYGIQPVIARNVSTTQQVMQRHQMCTFVRMAQGGGRGRQGYHSEPNYIRYALKRHLFRVVLA